MEIAITVQAGSQAATVTMDPQGDGDLVDETVEASSTRGFQFANSERVTIAAPSAPGGELCVTLMTGPSAMRVAIGPLIGATDGQIVDPNTMATLEVPAGCIVTIDAAPAPEDSDADGG